MKEVYFWKKDTDIITDDKYVNRRDRILRDHDDVDLFIILANGVDVSLPKC